MIQNSSNIEKPMVLEHHVPYYYVIAINVISEKHSSSLIAPPFCIDNDRNDAPLLLAIIQKNGGVHKSMI